MKILIYNFIINLFTSIVIYKFSLPFFRRYFLVTPNKRSSHTKATPSAGGIIFVLISCLNSLFNNFYVVLMCLPLSIIGLIDDRFDLKPLPRIISQVITVFFLLYSSTFYNSINNYSTFLIFLNFVFIIFICTGFINFINFVDGLDGLLAGTMSIILATLAIGLNDSLWSIIALLIGFIFFNWSPSKIFMGDVGSTFLGALFVGMIFQVNNSIDFIKIILLASPILGDALIAVLKRIFSGKSIIIPHKSFYFQRLNRAGWSHRSVSIFYIFLILPLSYAYLFGNIYLMISIIIFELLIYKIIEDKLLYRFQ